MSYLHIGSGIMRPSARHHHLLAAAAAALWGGGLLSVAHEAAGHAQKPMVSEGGGGRGEARVADDGGSPLTKEFGKFIEGLLEEWHVPGLALGVVDGDDTWTEV